MPPKAPKGQIVHLYVDVLHVVSGGGCAAAGGLFLGRKVHLENGNTCNLNK